MRILQYLKGFWFYQSKVVIHPMSIRIQFILHVVHSSGEVLHLGSGFSKHLPDCSHAKSCFSSLLYYVTSMPVVKIPCNFSQKSCLKWQWLGKIFKSWTLCCISFTRSIVFSIVLLRKSYKLQNRSRLQVNCNN